ncbi:hypothetical protein QL093DRAFT_2569592 [Fusarium oxysporum]|nr:hypothetical protein QL093DRAFT_2569592 [Fusarium oxysporum]
MEIEAFIEGTGVNTRWIHNHFEAIDQAKGCIYLANDSHPLPMQWLNDLGAFLARRYEWTVEINDLEEAIEIAQQAVKLTSNGYPDLAVALNNLGNILESRYGRLGDPRSLSKAIKAARRALELIQDVHPDRISGLTSLANKLAPNGHPGCSGNQNSLGNMLQDQYERTGDDTSFVGGMDGQEK